MRRKKSFEGGRSFLVKVIFGGKVLRLKYVGGVRGLVRKLAGRRESK